MITQSKNSFNSIFICSSQCDIELLADADDDMNDIKIYKQLMIEFETLMIKFEMLIVELKTLTIKLENCQRLVEL